MSQVDFKRAMNKMKHDLEPWRGLIITIDSLLRWEKNFYAAVVFAAISLFYITLWVLDLSTLTMLAVAGLVIMAFDFAYPTVSRLIFNTENWDGAQEMRFEEVCNQICSIKITFGAWYEFIFTAKEKKSTMFAVAMGMSLLTLAWIGAIIDNLLLMYFITLSTAMYPGIQKQGLVDLIKSKFGCIVNSKMQQLREKTKKAD